MKKFNAFTLAEVLITLGIIGVVAAMTMPTLINQTNGAQYKAAYKKALSAISQGVTLNVALDDESFADVVAGTAGATTKPTTGSSVASLLASRMNVVKTSGAPTGYSATYQTGDLTVDINGESKTVTRPTLDTYMFFNDSSMFAFASSAAACKDSAPCAGYIDVNGEKGPNKEVTDSSSPTDIYPVVFYDQTVLPATDIAREVLYSK